LRKRKPLQRRSRLSLNPNSPDPPELKSVFAFLLHAGSQMAIFHADVKVISRSDGRNSVACAAYRSGEKLRDETLHKTFDYSRRETVYDSEILAPENAPDWVHQRAWLWNEVERVENAHNRRDSAQLAREVMVALPTELAHDQKQELVRSYVRDQFTSKGMVADIGYHDFETQNPHAHIMLTLRRIEPEGFGKKERDWNHPTMVSQWRQHWAEHSNRALEQAGHTARIDHRSHKERGSDQIPLVHLGASVWRMEKDGLHQGKAAITDLGAQYQAIQVANDNRQRRQQEITRLEQEAAELRTIQRTRKVLQPEPAPDVATLGTAITKEVLETHPTPSAASAPAPSPTSDRPSAPELSPAAAEKATAAFRNIYQHYAQRTRHHKDPDAIDFAVCKIMAKRGWSDEPIAYGLRHASPDLEERKKQQAWEYAQRTVRNVAKQPDVQAARARQQETQTNDRERLKEIEPYKDRERRGAAEQTPRMGVASSPRRERPTPIPLSPEQQYQARWNAVQASYRKQDSSTYTGNALREYRKELERQKQLGVHDFDSVEVRQMVDKDITLRLLSAGYSRREVAAALQRGSPEATRQAADHPYGESMVVQSTQAPAARQTVRQYRSWIAEQGYTPQERRLDRLGLATTEAQTRPQDLPRSQTRGIEPER
jgi:hypothetical protein